MTTTILDEDRKRALRALERQRRASGTRLRYRALRHPLRLGYPTPSRIRKWKESGFSVQAKARTAWGQQLLVTLPDDVSVSLRWNGFFEYDLSAFYLRFLKAGMTFVDVGAHVGYFSLLASQAVGPRGRVIAFEPTPSTYTVLAANARGHDNVTPVNAAVWSEASTVALRDYGPCFSAYNSVFQPRLPDSVKPQLRERTHQVSAVRLDDYLAEQGAVPDAVKIDVESAEMEVLHGMNQVLTGPRPILSLEVGDMDVPGVTPSREVIETVLSHGYRPFELRDGRIRPHELRDRYTYENIVFAPAERACEFAGSADPAHL
jgi:FkbM family methyltransferase